MEWKGKDVLVNAEQLAGKSVVVQDNAAIHRGEAMHDKQPK